MAYHLSVVEIIHEINQQDTPPSPKPRTPEMSITRSYALIPENSNRVENIIVASDDYQRQGYYTVRYDEETFCQPGMYYNAKTGLFYDEPEFVTINHLRCSN